MGATSDLERAEQDLDSFEPAVRREALLTLTEAVEQGRFPLPPAGAGVNLHCHTFFSYNAYGYSPTKFAWLARKAGLAVAGIVDFDVLEGVEEFLEAGRLLRLKVCAGIETRVFLPELAGKVMSSPGEPGVCYHMGVAMPRAEAPAEWVPFLTKLRETSADRNRKLVQRVNEYLGPVALDYDRDVLPLTPAGNATERHICLAYARKAQEIFGDRRELADYWKSKLGPEAEGMELPESIGLQTLIRAKTMKLGGVGYVQPDTGSFPRMDEMNRFILAAGGIPAYAWLDGTSEGESDLDALLEVAVAKGVAAINVIPDRNYTQGRPDAKLRNLYFAVELAERLGLPVLAGTEMNSPGHKFVDDFESPELAPLAPALRKGAHIFYAHSVLQRGAGLGYTSNWASESFRDVWERNHFFAEFGAKFLPGSEDLLSGLTALTTPAEILSKLPS